MALENGAPPVARRRLIVYYGLLGATTAAVIAAILAIGGGEHPSRPIAGGYDVSAGSACLSPRVDVSQSGRFVGVDNAQSTVGGKLTLKGSHLTGAVDCVGGRQAKLDAVVGTGTLHGTVGGQPLDAALRRDPPAPGTLKQRAPASVDGGYDLSPGSACFGGKLALKGGRAVPAPKLGPPNRLTYRKGTLSGVIGCARGGQRMLTATATGRQLDVTLTPLPAAQAGATPEHFTAVKHRPLDQLVAVFFIALVVVMLAARLVGTLMARIGQPRVMGEVLAGIVLGPTVFGAIAPGLQSDLFPQDIISTLGVVANLGLIFYMFLVGLEVDLSTLRGRVGLTAAISNTGVAIPMMAGVAIALPLFHLVAPDTRFVPFALFVGVAMSITAFPVLARIIVERRMLKRPIGALALAAAAVDDVTAWLLIALATAFATAGSSSGVVLRTIALTVAFCLAMALAVRPILRRASVAREEMGRVPASWITAIFAGVLLSAFLTETIGIAVIFGAFVMGLAMPRHAGLTEDVTRRVEDFVVTLLLPLFFAFTGLKTSVGLLDRSPLVLMTLALIGIAIACKFGGAVLASRVMRLGWRESTAIGALMNTRGLTELIVLNLALEKGVISPALFAALVIMALVTTFMAGPLLKRIDPRNEFGEPIEEEFAAARRETVADCPGEVPETSILVAPLTAAALTPLRGLAEPLARSEPPRELVLARIVVPPRGAAVRGGLQTEGMLLDEASAEVRAERAALLERGVAARAVAFTSSQPGADLVRLCESESVDLLLVDGRRPLLGAGVPRGEVGYVLRRALSDVAVLVAREDADVVPGPERPVLIPFGGAEHDWAALELAAWMSHATGAQLKLLGAAGKTDDDRDASRLLGNASLLVQQFAGVAAEPVIADPGRDGVIAAAAGAGLLVIGLSERWRAEGLGETRAAIARAAPAPILFVRRGARPGVLASPDQATRFRWSSPAISQQQLD